MLCFTLLLRVIQLSYSMRSSQVSPTLCTFAITSILIPSILVQGQLDVGSISIGKQIIENWKLNSSFEQLLEETYDITSQSHIKAKLLKQIKDDLIQCQGLIMDLKDNDLGAKNTQSCFSIKGRYTGTDLIDSRIKELRTLSTQECQEKCNEHEECNYFLYFSLDHYQRFKHNTCRLLRFVLLSIRPVQDTFKKYLDTDTFKILSQKVSKYRYLNRSGSTIMV